MGELPRESRRGVQKNSWSLDKLGRSELKNKLKRRYIEMGDRRMAEIRTSEGSLWFYTHWTGIDLPQDAEDALELAKPRRGDEPYAVRRIVDHLILASGSRDAEIGSGLMLSPSAEDEYSGDADEVASVLIDVENWRVHVYNVSLSQVR